uniref:DNA-3-methyladenine glycosylase I n=2 Tax=Aegilops tauschii subsp. strangulata TaxID=200361 RepID=A0A453KWY4_AEGTS
PPRCPWVTRNTDPCYTAFHDQEWGVPVHDDRKLFEMLVLSGALAEMAWPVILSKRDAFREVFMDFDPLLVSKLNEKKFLGPCSPARSLLSEHRLRTIVENAHELLKVISSIMSLMLSISVQILIL